MLEWTPPTELELPKEHGYRKVTVFPVLYMMRAETKEDGTTVYSYEKKLDAGRRESMEVGPASKTIRLPEPTVPVANRLVGFAAFGLSAETNKYDEKPLAAYKIVRLYDAAMEELSAKNTIEFEKPALGSGEEE